MRDLKFQSKVNFNKKYINKSKFRKFKLLKFKSFKKRIPLSYFKKRYIKDFYTPYQLEEFRKFLGINMGLLRYALTKRYLLDKFIERKYNAYFPIKVFPNRFIRNRFYARKKNRKRKLKKRVKFLFRISYDNFLFYLTCLNKTLIIKPFNFFNSLFFYKSYIFGKAFVIRKRKRFNRHFFYQMRRIRRRRRFARRRMRYLRRYGKKKKRLIKRYKKFRIRRFSNFLRFIAFLNICKKHLVTNSYLNQFKIKSISMLPYKALILKFNKISNSYQLFNDFNINKRKTKQNIKFFSYQNDHILNNKKTKLYNIIKLKLKNRFNGNYKIDFNKKKKLIKIKNKKNLIFKNPVKFNKTITDYLNYSNLISYPILNLYYFNKKKNCVKRKVNKNRKLFKIIK